jgi:YegS/Rv2252/BmrU family lipid kinase
MSRRRRTVTPARTLLVVNPNAKHGVTGELVPVLAGLVDGAFPFEIATTDGAGHALEIARSAQGFDVVCAVGGDGTVHEVLNGLMSRPAEGRPALALLPTGSGNDYRRTLGVSTDLTTAVRQLAIGARARLDVGVCNDLYFANSISMGFDAKVTAKAVDMKRTTKRSGLSLYLSAMLDVMLHDFGSFHVRIGLDGGPEQARDALLMAVCIGPTYGGGFKIVPMAVPDDGLLDLLVIDALPQHGALWRFPFVVVGRHQWMRQTHFSRHTSLRVTSDGPLPGQIDGEVMLAETYDIRILPGAIEVVVPPEATP